MHVPYPHPALAQRHDQALVAHHRPIVALLRVHRHPLLRLDINHLDVGTVAADDPGLLVLFCQLEQRDVVDGDCFVDFEVGHVGLELEQTQVAVLARGNEVVDGLAAVFAVRGAALQV